MAVVQISRIQVRRGRKNQGSGLPQLAGGEFGWAVDARELYIGNGSVSEGAPYVGNTKILSENDNLFDFANNYTYKGESGLVITGPNGTSITRSLQDRLDDIVSLRAFGSNETIGDQTETLQRAIDQLFINNATVANPQSRVILHVEPGTYLISSTIFVPPYVTIKGAGKQKTIFNFTGTGPAFKTSRGIDPLGAEDPRFTSSDYEDTVFLTNNSNKKQARNIHLSDFTVNIVSGAVGIEINTCRDSIFSNLEFIGNYDLNDGDTWIGQTPQEVGILLNSFSSAVTCENNTFKNITIKQLHTGIYSDDDIKNNTLDDLYLETLYQGIIFGAGSDGAPPNQVSGPSFNTIKNSIFRDISQQGIYIELGKSNISQNNKFYLTGNETGNDTNPVVPVIDFVDKDNTTFNDWFERTEALGNNPTYIDTISYIPEVSLEAFYENKFTYKLVPFSSPSTFEKFFRLPADRPRAFEIEYVYKSDTTTRNGVMRISVDPVNNFVTFMDDFELVGLNDDHSDQLLFKAQGYSLDSTPTNPIDTVAVMMLNSTGDTNPSFYYRVKTLT